MPSVRFSHVLYMVIQEQFLIKLIPPEVVISTYAIEVIRQTIFNAIANAITQSAAGRPLIVKGTLSVWCNDVDFVKQVIGAMLNRYQLTLSQIDMNIVEEIHEIQFENKRK